MNEWSNGNVGAHANKHSKCQNGINCTGPGCRVRTGKTHAKRAGINRGAEALIKSIQENKS